MTTTAPLILVSWLDAAFRQFEETAVGPDEAKKEDGMIGCVNHTVGYKIRDDAEGVVLGMEWCEGDEKYRHLMEIPRPYIRGITELTRKRRRPISASSVDLAPPEDPKF